MSNKNHSGDSAQLSLFDILGLAGNIDSQYSSDEIEEVIGKLRAAKRIAEKHEENERRRREKEEAERKAREEKERKDAHVREVTCMDLPLDWNNIFNSDVRTQGVHAESLCEIAKLIAKQKGLKFTEEAFEKLSGLFNTARSESDFGNGRYVRNVIEKAKMAQATRLLTMNFDSIGNDDITTITAEDIELPKASAKSKAKQIGFCA